MCSGMPFVGSAQPSSTKLVPTSNARLTAASQICGAMGTTELGWAGPVDVGAYGAVPSVAQPTKPSITPIECRPTSHPPHASAPEVSPPLYVVGHDPGTIGPCSTSVAAVPLPVRTER